MTFDDYQLAALKTVIYPRDKATVYPTLGLVGEAGEIANKLKKVYRDAGGQFSGDAKDSLADELGDVLWYAAALAADLGYDLSAVARMNLEKLSGRAVRGRLGGSGDER